MLLTSCLLVSKTLNQGGDAAYWLSRCKALGTMGTKSSHPVLDVMSDADSITLGPKASSAPHVLPLWLPGASP